jgi:hypothetical protein
MGGESAVANTSRVVRVEVMVDGGVTEEIEKVIKLPKQGAGFVIQQ